MTEGVERTGARQRAAAAKHALEAAFPLSQCQVPGSNSNVEDAKLLEALYRTRGGLNSSPRDQTESEVQSGHATASVAAYLTVGYSFLPFALLEDPSARLGGISEELIVVADYDEMQLRISQALTEVVRRIDATDGSPLAVCLPEKVLHAVLQYRETQLVLVPWYVP